MFRPQPISSTDARKYFTKIINKVQFSSKSFVIKSYRQPIVRVVNENYIRALEEVIGKKTVNQIMQIAGNDRLFESEKREQIKKVFQRRLSGSPSPRPKPSSKGRPASGGRSQPPVKHPTPKQVSQNVAAGPRPAPLKPKNNQKTKRVLLLSNGKNYA